MFQRNIILPKTVTLPFELDSFGKDIGRSLASLLASWGDEDSASKSLLRRISTKSRKFLKKKKRHFDEEEFTEDVLEKDGKRVESVGPEDTPSPLMNSVEEIPLKPPALFSSKSIRQRNSLVFVFEFIFCLAPDHLSRTLTYRRLPRFQDPNVRKTKNPSFKTPPSQSRRLLQTLRFFGKMQ